MKVGIITQPLLSNYGGILQNYALQQVLKQMGHLPVTLDYLPSLSFGRYILYVGKSLLFMLIPSRRHKIKPYKHFLLRSGHIDDFVGRNINCSRKIPKYTKRLVKNNGIDALIVGSDQVWRYKYNSHYITDMYLSFVQKYSCVKIAYGASFGVDEWDYPADITQCVCKLIKLFDAVSVRENTGSELCRKVLGVDAPVVLDPTLLLESSGYEPFCKVDDFSELPYLAAYVLDMTEKKRNFIESVAISKGLVVKYMSVSDKGVSIEEWLSAIKNAKFVITDSYHGSLFSIIFSKQFLTILNKERGSDRFYTVVDLLGLRSRLIDNDNPSYDIDTVIDYSSVNSILEKERGRSLLFLKNCMS